MSTHAGMKTGYTIMEAARLSGLPESTLRYYETIGLIQPIRRDASSKHRVYNEGDVNHVISIACLNATGISIEDMRAYLHNRSRGAEAAAEQIALLETQARRLSEEAQYLQLRQRYVDTKVAYWKAVATGDEAEIVATKAKADAIVKELKIGRN